MNVHKNAKLTPAGRAELVRRVLIEKQKVGEAGQAMGVSARTVRKWVKRYQSGGVRSLADRSSRPRRSPRTFPRKVVERIERLLGNRQGEIAGGADGKRGRRNVDERGARLEDRLLRLDVDRGERDKDE